MSAMQRLLSDIFRWSIHTRSDLEEQKRRHSSD